MSVRKTKMASSIHAVLLQLAGGNNGATLRSTDEEGKEVRTSIIANHSEWDEKTDPSTGKTHLVGEAGPPHNDKYPNLVEDWDVSVLRNPRLVGVQSYEHSVNWIYHQKEIEN